MSEQLPPRAPQLRPILDCLLRHGVDFVLIGGLAGMAHGSSYPSYDIDIAYARDRANLKRLVAALGEMGVWLPGAPSDLPFKLSLRTLEKGANFTFVTPYGDLDLLGEVDGVSSYGEDAVDYEIEGFAIPVASIDHLIAMKRASNRTKDRIMLEEYIAIAEEQRRG